MSEQSVTYIAVKREDLLDLVERMDKPTMLDLDGAFREFGFTKTFIYTLIREGKIKAYPVADHPKVVRYRYDELKSVFINQ